MTTIKNSFFESWMLTEEQQQKRGTAWGTRSATTGKIIECPGGCIIYLGATWLGEHTYFWHYGASDGYVVLGEGCENPHLDYGTLEVTTFSPSGERKWDLDGVEWTPRFEMLVHLDLRKIPEDDRVWEDYQIQSGSFLPDHTTKAMCLPKGFVADWVGHVWLAPWEMTKVLHDAALAITCVKVVNGERQKIVIL